MDREYGAPEALAMIRRQDFRPSDVACSTLLSAATDPSLPDLDKEDPMSEWRFHDDGRRHAPTARHHTSASACWAMPSMGKAHSNAFKKILKSRCSPPPAIPDLVGHAWSQR